LLALEEDRGAVLRADVVALTVLGGGVVDGEEDPQQVAVADDLWVEGHLHHLGVAGLAGAHLLVGGVGYVAAGVARLDALHALELVVDRLEATEAAARQGGDLCRVAVVHRWLLTSHVPMLRPAAAARGSGGRAGRSRR